MRKIITTTAIMIMSLFALAQTSIPKIQLIATGFAGPDPTQNYVVIEVPKLNKNDLYKKTLTYLNGLYKNPAAVLNTVDGESITVNGITDAIKTDPSYSYTFKYNIKLLFKDGKIRFEPSFVELNEVLNSTNSAKQIYLSSLQSPTPNNPSCIYLIKQGSTEAYLFKKDIKNSLDLWANSYATAIVKSFSDTW